MIKNKILVIDDEESILDFLGILFTKNGYGVKTSNDPIKAINLVKKEDFDIIFLDLQMPKMSGLEALINIKKVNPEVMIIIITAHGDTKVAVDVMKKGAYDFIEKPFEPDSLILKVKKAIESKNLKKENIELKTKLNETYEYMDLVGSSREMLKIYEMIEVLSKTFSNVLITGESGTGKELVAKAIHNKSERKEQPFVVINCGAIPENLMESEMFGHKKGSFTGAINDKVGLFEITNKGTIFLDEVSELPTHLQVKLLRVIQEKTIRRVGDVKDINIDVRIIAATNQDLDKKVTNKEFREDLYYRLNVIEIDIPPLRERKEDIPMLVNYFIKKYSKKLKKTEKKLSEEVKNTLLNHPFYGNVRELENIVERFISLSKDKIINLSDLPKKINGTKITEENYKLSIPKNNFNKALNLEKITTDYEKDLIQKALEETNGIKTKAAKYLGISFRSLRYRLKKYNIN